MKLKADDSCFVSCDFTMSDDDILSLCTLYQPLMKAEAVLLYMTLYAQKKSAASAMTHRYLSRLTGMHSEVLEKARIALEEYKLLRTYERVNENTNSYVYELQKPLRSADFLSVRTFRSQLTNALGQSDTSLAELKTASEHVSRNGYREVTRPVIHFADSGYENDVEFTELKPRYQFGSPDETILFDYDRFISTTHTLVFPAELRTEENMYLIGKLATIYGLSADTMRVLVKSCTDLVNMKLNTDKLKMLASRRPADTEKTDDPYRLSPASFLQSLQNGRPVSRTDKDILEYLALDMKFAPEVINVMIEYILKCSDNRLNRKFVEMVAGEWARDNVTTKEQALKETRKTLSYANRPSYSSVSVPEYMKRQAEGTAEEDPSKASEEQLERIRKLLGGENTDETD